jgi:vibriolysin
MAYMKLLCGLGLSVAALAGTGCAIDVGGGDGTSTETETVGEVSSPFTTAACSSATYDGCWDQTDASGKVSVRMYMCKESVAGSTVAGVCPVEADRVLVGGGGQESTFGANGSLLTHSAPSGKAGGNWIAISKAHVYPDVHKVRAYAIGLKLTGFSASQLAAAVQTVTVTSPVAAHPGVVAIPPSGTILLGGGAYTNNADQLLTGSVPTAGGWVAKAKEHIIPNHGTVTAIALSIPACPAGLGYCIESKVGPASGNSAPTGYHTQTANAGGTSPVISIGGDAFSGGPGRMLVSLYPLPTALGMSVMVSKDHGFVDNGSDLASYITLRAF